MSALSDNIVFATLNAMSKFTGAQAGKDLADSKATWPGIYAAAAGEEDSFATDLGLAIGANLNLAGVEKIALVDASDLASAEQLVNRLKANWNILVDQLASAGCIPE
jgi:geranylgeranyl pyrophosphate synthase